jgi:D-aminopeptidase
VRSINPVVGETNDGALNDIRSRPVGREEVFEALRSAKGGPVAEGSVGAGAGTIAFGFKGGIGTSSRRLPPNLGGWTVGVLVQSNFGGVLQIAGVPVGEELGQYYLRNELMATGGAASSPGGRQNPNGSCMIIVATDAPVDARNLKRVAARAIMGLARTGASGSNGSGDYAIAFSTVRVDAGMARLANDSMSPLFLATIEATEEAIYNSLTRATTVTGNGTTIEAIPIDRLREILRKHGR